MHATVKKAEQKKAKVNLPMRGRRMLITDKLVDHQNKIEVYKRDIIDRESHILQNQSILDRINENERYRYNTA